MLLREGLHIRMCPFAQQVHFAAVQVIVPVGPGVFIPEERDGRNQKHPEDISLEAEIPVEATENCKHRKQHQYVDGDEIICPAVPRQA